jgi:hypothetical protein
MQTYTAVAIVTGAVAMMALAPSTEAATIEVLTTASGPTTVSDAGTSVKVAARITDPAPEGATGIQLFVVSLQITNPATLAYVSATGGASLDAGTPFSFVPDASVGGLFMAIGAFDESVDAGASPLGIELFSITLKAVGTGSTNVQAGPGIVGVASFTLYPLPSAPAGPYIETDGRFLAGPSFDVTVTAVPLPAALPAGIALLIGTGAMYRPTRQWR